jgi:hypothetical protein
VSGLKGLPKAGDALTAVNSEQRARALSAARAEREEEYRASRMAGALYAQASDPISYLSLSSPPPTHTPTPHSSLADISLLVSAEIEGGGGGKKGDRC